MSSDVTPRILFVDDEEMILSSMRRSLRAYRKAWDMKFVSSGQAALAHLADNPCDIIISDMRMPQMDGAELLSAVQQSYPHMMRIILSGYAENEQVVKTVNVAHQYLAKPCQADMIERVINQSFALMGRIHSEEVKSFISQVDSLPTPPRLYGEVMKALNDEACTPEVISSILEQDSAMVAKILKIANSSFFALQQKVNTCKEAVASLGYHTVQGLILQAHIFSTTENELLAGFDAEALHTACLERSELARRIVLEHNGEDEKMAHEAFVASLLLGVGELLCWVYQKESYAQLLEQCREDKCLIEEAESQQLGVTHSQMGAYLIGLWGLSYEFTETVAYSACPALCPVREWGILPACYMAARIAEMKSHGLSVEQAQFDYQYLKEVGITEEYLAKYF